MTIEWDFPRSSSHSQWIVPVQGETVSQTGNGMRLSGIDGDPQRRPIMAYANPFNGLPMSVGYHYGSVTEATQQLANTVSVIHDNNFNLSAAQKEWWSGNHEKGLKATTVRGIVNPTGHGKPKNMRHVNLDELVIERKVNWKQDRTKVHIFTELIAMPLRKAAGHCQKKTPDPLSQAQKLASIAC